MDSALKKSVTHAVVSMLTLAIVAFGGWLFFRFGPSYLFGQYLELVEWIWCALIAAFAVMIIVDPLRLSIRGGFVADLIVTLTWGALIVYFFTKGGPKEVFGAWAPYFFMLLSILVLISLVTTVVHLVIYEVRHARRIEATRSGELTTIPAPSAQNQYQVSAVSSDYRDVKVTSPAQIGDVAAESSSSQKETTSVPVLEVALEDAHAQSSAWEAWDEFAGTDRRRLSDVEASVGGLVLSPLDMVLSFDNVQLRRYVAGSFVDGGWVVTDLPSMTSDTGSGLLIARKADMRALVACFDAHSKLTLAIVQAIDELANQERCNGVVVIALGGVEDDARAFAGDVLLTLWEADDLVDFI